MTKMRLDEVSIFGDKLRFLIPHEWVEGEDENNTYLYHAPNTDSGWLRVSLITVNTVEPAMERLRAIFGDSTTITTDSKTGNLVDLTEKDSSEDGTSIHIYCWRVANGVPPNVVREAIFSYTVLAAHMQDSETRRTVRLLSELVSQAVFV
jgi:hypothetical protein